MVRRIDICLICQERFIALRLSHIHCDRCCPSGTTNVSNDNIVVTTTTNTNTTATTSSTDIPSVLPTTTATVRISTVVVSDTLPASLSSSLSSSAVTTSQLSGAVMERQMEHQKATAVASTADGLVGANDDNVSVVVGADPLTSRTTTATTSATTTAAVELAAAAKDNSESTVIRNHDNDNNSDDVLVIPPHLLPAPHNEIKAATTTPTTETITTSICNKKIQTCSRLSSSSESPILQATATTTTIPSQENKASSSTLFELYDVDDDIEEDDDEDDEQEEDINHNRCKQQQQKKNYLGDTGNEVDHEHDDDDETRATCADASRKNNLQYNANGGPSDLQFGRLSSMEDDTNKLSKLVAASSEEDPDNGNTNNQCIIDLILSSDDDENEQEPETRGRDEMDEEDEEDGLVSEADEDITLLDTCDDGDSRVAAPDADDTFVTLQTSGPLALLDGSIIPTTAASSSSGTLPLDNSTKNNNVNLEVCFVCGQSLLSIQTGYGGRVNHIKRCSKKHGVTVKDVRFNDDYELFDVDGTSDHSALPRMPNNSLNPYQRKNLWHGDVATSAPTTTTTVSASLPKVRSAFEVMMDASRAKRCAVEPNKSTLKPQSLPAAATTSQNQNSKRRRNNSSYRSNGTKSGSYRSGCPAYKKIPGTDFCCDGFQYASPNLTSNYFLTHFHSDHYGGITKGWNNGTIYCSIPTANLVHQQLGVSRQYLHPLPMGTPTVIESKGIAVTVTLLHANHCPGAIMFLFEVGKRVILHVGDFRWNYAIMSSQAALSPYCRVPWSDSTTSQRRIDDLFLDTTYCDAQYSLPSQTECIEATVEVAQREIQQAQASKSRILLLFGAYTIGKEILYMTVAKRLGLQVYVEPRRHRVLSALDWPAEDMALLTTRPHESILWVVPLGHINMKQMPTYQTIRRKDFVRDFDRVVGFRPTGWSHTSPSLKKNQRDSSIVGTTTRKNLTVYSVPYSEHSSFPELVECIECLNPKRIIPTVSVSKSQEQVDLLLYHWRTKKSNLLLRTCEPTPT